MINLTMVDATVLSEKTCVASVLQTPSTAIPLVSLNPNNSHDDILYILINLSLASAFADNPKSGSTSAKGNPRSEGLMEIEAFLCGNKSATIRMPIQTIPCPKTSTLYEFVKKDLLLTKNNGRDDSKRDTYDIRYHCDEKKHNSLTKHLQNNCYVSELTWKSNDMIKILNQFIEDVHADNHQEVDCKINSIEMVEFINSLINPPPLEQENSFKTCIQFSRAKDCQTIMQLHLEGPLMVSVGFLKQGEKYTIGDKIYEVSAKGMICVPLEHFFL